MQIALKWLAEKTNQLVLFLLVGGLLFRSFLAFSVYPTFDEAYYYLYSLHLDWSYFDHPFLVGLTTGFGPWLTGSCIPIHNSYGSANLLHRQFGAIVSD
jgi:hypothetical protein